MNALIELMNKKLDEIEARGDLLVDCGYFPKDSNVLHKYSTSKINTSNPHLPLLFSIIPLIFTPAERKSIGSYNGKHIVEKLLSSTYISNGEFILVMMCLDYKMKSYKDSPNVSFSGYWNKNIDNELKYKFNVNSSNLKSYIKVY